MMRRDARPFDLDEALARISPVQRPCLAMRVWHRRHAVLIGGVLPIGLLALGAAVHPLAPVSLVASLVIAVVTTPELRRWGQRRARCIRVPNIVRATFERGRVCAPDGRLPTVLWTSPTPLGVRVRVKCPFGMPAVLIERAAGLVRDACGADDVIVIRERGSRTVVIGLTYTSCRQW